MSQISNYDFQKFSQGLDEYCKCVKELQEMASYFKQFLQKIDISVSENKVRRMVEFLTVYEGYASLNRIAQAVNISTYYVTKIIDMFLNHPHCPWIQHPEKKNYFTVHKPLTPQMQSFINQFNQEDKTWLQVLREMD